MRWIVAIGMLGFFGWWLHRSLETGRIDWKGHAFLKDENPGIYWFLVSLIWLMCVFSILILFLLVWLI